MNSEIKVSELYGYWIKSCGGTSLQTAEVTARGIKNDRHWMLVDSDGNFLTQRELPRMALIRPELTNETLVLKAKGIDSIVEVPIETDGQSMQVKVWDDVYTAIIDSPEASAWFSSFLGIDAALVHMANEFTRPDRKQLGQVGFADAYPFLILSQGSLNDLNDRMAAKGAPRLPINRFRPNIVVDGCKPYAEDTWASFLINGLTYAVVKPCVRCPITTTDQETAIRYKEPLKTLAIYRRTEKGVIFAQNAVNLGTGSINVGDRVEVIKK